MNPEFERLYLIAEKTHPWFVYRRKLIWNLIKKTKRDARILEIGCGSGINLAMLKKKGFKHLIGIEPSKGMKRFQKDIQIFPDTKKIHGKFDLILMLDVLEHIKDDAEMLKKMNTLLNANGRIILTVPAFNFLWSAHDDLNKHYRRYNNRLLYNLVKKAQLRIIRRFYWNSFMFLPIAMLNFLKTKKKSDVEFMPKIIAGIYSLILQIENFIISCGVNPSIGISLVAILRKKKNY